MEIINEEFPRISSNDREFPQHLTLGDLLLLTAVQKSIKNSFIAKLKPQENGVS